MMQIEEEGIVVEVTGRSAMVKAVEKPECAGCGASASCHVSPQGGERIVEVDNGPGANPGDQVVIAVPAGAFLRASFQVYMVPVLGILAGAGFAQILVQALAGPRAAGMAAGIGGLLGGILSVMAVRLLRRRSGGPELRPKIVRVV